MCRHNATLCLFTIFFTMAVLTSFPAIGFAQEPDEAMPERQVTMAVEYPGIELQAGKDVTMDILFHNKCPRDHSHPAAPWYNSFFGWRKFYFLHPLFYWEFQVKGRHLYSIIATIYLLAVYSPFNRNIFL